jgi:hypothetical protein
VVAAATRVAVAVPAAAAAGKAKGRGVTETWNIKTVRARNIALSSVAAAFDW